MKIENKLEFPIKFVELLNNRTIKLNSDVLKSILLSENIKNMPLVIISFVGDYRKGMA